MNEMAKAVTCCCSITVVAAVAIERAATALAKRLAGVDVASTTFDTAVRSTDATKVKATCVLAKEPSCVTFAASVRRFFRSRAEVACHRARLSRFICRFARSTARFASRATSRAVRVPSSRAADSTLARASTMRCAARRATFAAHRLASSTLRSAFDSERDPVVGFILPFFCIRTGINCFFVSATISEPASVSAPPPVVEPFSSTVDPVSAATPRAAVRLVTCFSSALLGSTLALCAEHVSLWTTLRPAFLSSAFPLSAENILLSPIRDTTLSGSLEGTSAVQWLLCHNTRATTRAFGFVS